MTGVNLALNRPPFSGKVILIGFENYYLIARSEYGLMVQIFGGLITYLLMAIYCHEEFNEKVSIKRVRQLRIKILNELFNGQDDSGCTDDNDSKEQRKSSDAKT